MTPNKNSIPNYILFLFYGTLVIGFLYLSFSFVFLGSDPSLRYQRAMSGTEYAIPTLAIVPAKTADSIENGKLKYTQACVACHGIYGQHSSSLIGPNLADAEWLHSNQESQLAPLVMRGISAAQSITKQVMPARGGATLSDSEVWTIIYYLSSQNPSIMQDAEPTK